MASRAQKARDRHVRGVIKATPNDGRRQSAGQLVRGVYHRGAAEVHQGRVQRGR